MEVRFPLILDGATGTQLQKYGYSGAQCAEQWILDNPNILLKIQEEYVRAGSQVLYTPTFGANRKKLEEGGIFNRTVQMNHELAALSKQAAQKKALIAGDMAPTGIFLSPFGDASFEELVDIYTEQAAALEQADVDLFIVETMISLADARAAVLAIRSVSDKPVFVTFTCDEHGRSITGTDMVAALTVLQGMGISAFGLNCSTGPDKMLVQLQRLRKYARIPLIAKPNAGMPKIVESKAIYDCPPDRFAQYIPSFLEAGVAIFGGCCGTDESHIAALCSALKNASCRKPDPEFTDLLPAATEKDAVYLPANANHGEILSVGDSLENDLERVLADSWPVVALRLEDWSDLDTLADIQYTLNKPLCLVCDDIELLQAGLRLYQGRALYEGPLTVQQLAPLQNRYGLLI